MNPQVLAIMALVQGAIAASPAIIEAAASARNLVKSLFALGLVSASEQNDLFSRIDGWCALALSNQRPEHWKP